MRITICKALFEDANNYVDCLISCWQSAYKGIVPDEFLNNMPTEKNQRIERYKKSLINPDIETYCVINEEKMIGFLCIHKKDGEIWAIYLIEEFCGKGYGKKVLDFAVNELKRIGHKQIFLWVFEENNRARRFYEKNNFYLNGAKREMTYGKPLVQLRYVCDYTE